MELYREVKDYGAMKYKADGFAEEVRGETLWLEPIKIAEEEINDIIFNNIEIDTFGNIEDRNAWIDVFSIETGTKAILSKLKGE